jgi:Domain of unknown function (DUF5615)
MIRLLADENFDNRIIRGVRRENEAIDIVRVQDTEIYQADDPTVLAWAAEQNRVLMTHDISTIPKYAYERVAEGQTMSGVIAVHLGSSIGEVIEDIVLLVGTSEAKDIENQVVYLPLK